jgi:cytochrome c
MMKKLLVTFAVVMITFTVARAADVRATPEDAEELVKSAVAYLKRHGEFKAFREFENRSGPFVYRDLYVGVYDEDGRCLSHGADPGKSGKALSAQPEQDQAIIRARLQAMKGKDAGWAEYDYKNPANGKVEPKVVYTERVGRLLVSAGGYKAVR